VLKEFDIGLRSFEIPGPWVNIDGRLGVVNLAPSPEDFVVIQEPGRNVNDGSLHFDTLLCPGPRYFPHFKRGETILDSAYLITAASAEATEALGKAYRAGTFTFDSLTTAGY
jgi:hypothetical protein